MLYRYTTFLGSEHPLATEAAQALQTDGQSGAWISAWQILHQLATVASLQRTSAYHINIVN